MTALPPRSNFRHLCRFGLAVAALTAGMSEARAERLSHREASQACLHAIRSHYRGRYEFRDQEWDGRRISGEVLWRDGSRTSYYCDFRNDRVRRAHLERPDGEESRDDRHDRRNR